MSEPTAAEEKPLEQTAEATPEVKSDFVPPEPRLEQIPVIPLPPAPPAAPPAVSNSDSNGGTLPRVLVPPLCCPECNKGPFESEQALSAHVRFKHLLPRKRKEAADRKAQEKGETNGQAIPAPDFADIEGAQPVLPKTQADGAQAPGVSADTRFEAMAAMTFDMTTGLLARVFGDEKWLSKDMDPQGERATMILGIKKYYASVNMPDIPPGYMLCFLCVAYAAPRLGNEPTKTKLQRGWLWLKSKFSFRRHPAPVPIVRLATEAKP